MLKLSKYLISNYTTEPQLQKQYNADTKTDMQTDRLVQKAKK